MRGAADIAADLRRDFLLAFQTEFERAPTSDPVLAVLFHALGVQIGRVYQEAEDVFPWQVLDDLMAGLAMPRPSAAPAQTVVSFTNLDRRERIGSDLALQGMSKTGEQLTFAPDASIELQPTSLKFAGVAEGGRLHVIPGATLPTGLPWPPGAVPCAAASGPPAILLAFQCDDAHLSGLGLHLRTSAIGSQVAGAIGRSPWIVLDADGVSREKGTLRAQIGRGGVNYLEWFDERKPLSDEDDLSDTQKAVDIGSGPFGEQVWVLPPVPAERRWRGKPPTRFRDALRAVAPDTMINWYDTDHVWVYIPLPAGTTTVANGLQGITLNAITASNIEVFTEQVNFGKTGQVVSMRPEGDGKRHIMGILSVIGEFGSRYVPESDLTAPEGTGRLRMRDDRIELRPAKRTGGRFDGYAVLRLLLCDGKRGNDMEAGSVRRILGRLGNITAQVSNITTSRGGAAPPTYGGARVRFAELLRTRERVVTAPDFEVTARAFDPRIETVQVTSISEVAKGALQSVDLVAVTVPREQLPDPDADVVRIRHGLERQLERRSVLGRRVRVSVTLRD